MFVSVLTCVLSVCNRGYQHGVSLRAALADGLSRACMRHAAFVERAQCRDTCHVISDVTVPRHRFHPRAPTVTHLPDRASV